MLARFARAGALVLALASPLACVHRGASWQADPAPLGDPTFGVIAIGQPRPGRASREVARELDSLLARERAAGRETLVIWLGHDFGPVGGDRLRADDCPTASPWLAPGMREFAATLDEHVRSGGAIWGLPGPDAWRCGAPENDHADAPAIAQPASAYLVRVHADGRSELASRCDHDGCTITALAPEADPTAIELVFIDPSAWVYPELDQPGSPAHAALVELDALLAALAEHEGPPRVLVSTIPIESSGLHGSGGRRPRSALRWQPESVRRAISEGAFVGVIAGLERDLQASGDLSGAIVRSNRSFLRAPVFQVISGASGGARPTLPVNRGNSLINELESNHAGFAHLQIELDVVRIELHARVAGRWRVGTLALPLAPAPLPSLREVPAIQPCLRCDPVRSPADGEVWFDR